MLKKALFFAGLMIFLSGLCLAEDGAKMPAKAEIPAAKQAEIAPKAAAEVMKACHGQDGITASMVDGDANPDAMKAFYDKLKDGSIQAVVITVTSDEMKMCDKNNSASGVKCQSDASVASEIIRSLKKKVEKHPSLEKVIALLGGSRSGG